jgi:hypothetical protein
MDYLILGEGQNFYATVGIFLSGARNNPQECWKIPQNVGKFHSIQWKRSVSPFPHKMALNKLFN